ncbi:hypothetical protein B0E51_08360 [Rhodanobacter sp. C05]|nr:hypothetical protein B0E51_08360 [Rhodanobacter sp. C05]
MLTVEDLAAVLRRARSTILSDLRRAQHRVPPTCTPRGTRKPLWRPEDVEAWLQAAVGQVPARKERRRSANAATTAKLAAEISAELEASARVQGAGAPPPGEPAQPGLEASA